MRLDRRALIAGLGVTLAAIPFRPLSACIHAGLHARITFKDVPDEVPEGFEVRHVHLTNQVPEFDEWRAAQQVDVAEKDVELRGFSVIGVAAEINPYIYWLTRLLPKNIVGRPNYIPILAPASSCTRNFSYEEPLDEETILIGRELTLANGGSVFAASSYRQSDDRWETYNSRLGRP
ncbi:hypothetical protein FIU90_09995 [Erythrobacter sp. THAF29]|nr:hypothetical protein FIU90_09995 [Erythrobacter sp. THAF29]